MSAQLQNQAAEFHARIGPSSGGATWVGGPGHDDQVVSISQALTCINWVQSLGPRTTEDLMTGIVQKGLAFLAEGSGTEGVLIGLWPERNLTPPA
jgi:hypothetical protein